MLDMKKMVMEQRKLAKKVSVKDGFEKLELLGGAEGYVVGQDIVAGIVVCDAKTFEIVDKALVFGKTPMPYKSGFRAYREGPGIGEAYSKLEKKPDVLFFAGNGILHPERVGLASHMGTLLDQPSVGVAKENMLGEEKDGFVLVEGEKRAALVKTKEHAKPVYVSPGHRVSLKTAVKLVRNSLVEPHKMPEPLHLARKAVKNAYKQKYGKE